MTMPTPSSDALPAMVAFAVYEEATGRVLRAGTMADEASAQMQAQAGEAIYLGHVPPLHFIAAGKPMSMGSQPSPAHVFDWATQAWVDPRTIDEIRAACWAKIKAQRDLIEASGFPYLGKQLDSDTRSVQRINTAVQAAQAALAANEPFDIVWTCADNTALALDGTGMLGVPVALALHADHLHQTAKQLRAQIDGAATKAEVEAIAWPTPT